MPAGRPTKYTPELVEQAWAYIEDYKDYGDAFPSLVGLCRAIKITKTTAYHWAGQDNNEFSTILENVADASEHRLLNGAITNELNSNIAKLVLGKHGYSDKQEVKADLQVTEHEKWAEDLPDDPDSWTPDDGSPDN